MSNYYKKQKTPISVGKEYVMKAEFNGKDRELVISHPSYDVYNVTCDSLYIGTIIPIVDEDLGLRWTANNGILLGWAQRIGEYIESCDAQ